jgi:HTH-type transcriptional regulator / antitoxin HigA
MQNTTRTPGKMTLTFSSEKYTNLLVKYQPKIIKTEEENERALAVVEELMHVENRTPEQESLYELLILLIEKFEDEFYRPGSASNPHSILQFLMEQQGVEPEDLVEVVGSKDVVFEVLNTGGEISQELAQVLGRFFKVDSSCFQE